MIIIVKNVTDHLFLLPYKDLDAMHIISSMRKEVLIDSFFYS